MRHFFKFSMIGLVVGAASSAIAGWNSGGGHYLNDRLNPWFLGNTAEVRYCIQIDEANFGVGEAEAQESIDEALVYWKTQLATLSLESDVPPILKVGTQSFAKTLDCNGADIRFQFGVLTRTQRSSDLPDPSRFAGATIRKSYDKETMKGKGYVYISPEHGPLKLKDNPIDRRWSRNNGIRLTYMLVHEIGHIFGLTQSESKNARLVMGPDFANSLLDPSPSPLLQRLLDEEVLVPMFDTIAGKEFHQCFASNDPDNLNAEAMWKNYLPVIEGYQCFKLVVPQDFENSQPVEIHASKTLRGTFQQLGTLKIMWKQNVGTVGPMISIFVPQEQQVSTDLNSNRTYLIYDDGTYSYSGSFVSHKNGSKVQYPLTLEPLGFSFLGVRLLGVNQLYNTIGYFGYFPTDLFQ